MKTHLLKTWPEHFQAVKSRVKKVELRLNDRDYQVGDKLVLKEFDPKTLEYTGDEVNADVSHIIFEGTYGLRSQYVALSLDNVII